MTLSELDARLDVALDRRVRAHELRKAGALSVPAYKRELAAVRKIEDELEPQRVELGAQCSRAMETALQHTGAEETCRWCGGENTVGTCPRSLECPTCQAAPGARCVRPSEHSGPMVAMHAARIEAAEAPGPAVLRPEPMLRQLDAFGGSRDLAPQTEAMRLFEPAPAQLPGQTYMANTNESEQR